MGSNNALRGIEQGRASFAYTCAEKGKGIKKYSEYKSYTKKIPMMIKTNGLGAAFAFVKSKGSADKKKSGFAYTLLYEQTTDWLKQDPKKLIALHDDDDLVEKIITLTSQEYRAVTIEVLAFFNWLKRFAEGLIGDKEGTDS